MSINPALAPPPEVQNPGAVPASAAGEVVGLQSEQDQLGAQRQKPLVLRRAIADAQDAKAALFGQRLQSAADFDQLRNVAHGLRRAAVSLHDAHVAPAQTNATISILADSLTRRSIELSISELGPPPCPLSWVALGSHGRREPVPGSDMDSALTWDGDEGDRDAKSYMLSLGSRVCDGLARCGLAADEREATAAQDLFVRPVSGWRRLIRESINEPRANKGLIVISLFLDGRVLHQEGDAPELHQEFQAASGRRGLLRLMLSLALANRPLVGRLREFVVESSGEHRGLLDIKHGGLLPVTSIARYASLAAGTIGSSSTPERLSAADAAGTLDSDFACTLSEAFKLFQGFRLDHQVQQIRRGIEPDDYLDPEAIDPPRRRELRDAFREVRAVQKKLGRQLSGEIAFA